METHTTSVEYYTRQIKYCKTLIFFTCYWFEYWQMQQPKLIFNWSSPCIIFIVNVESFNLTLCSTFYTYNFKKCLFKWTWNCTCETTYLQKRKQEFRTEYPLVLYTIPVLQIVDFSSKNLRPISAYIHTYKRIFSGVISVS